MIQLIMSQGWSRFIRLICFLTIMISTVYLESCRNETSHDIASKEPTECETIFSSIFSLNHADSLKRDYINQFSSDSNTFNAYIIYPILSESKEEQFECEAYVMNQTDFMLPELNRDGIYFCITESNSIRYFGKDIDKDYVEYSINYFLQSWYKQAKDKSENFILTDSIDIRIDIHCRETFLTQPSFDWITYSFLMNEVYYTLHQFRSFILNDYFGVDLKYANEKQLETINRFYNPLIYISHRDLECMLFEKPKKPSPKTEL